MKKFLKIVLPLLLSFTILFGIFWYLFHYDRDFTRDVLLSFARHYEIEGDMDTASWFYDMAYDQGSGNDEIAIELSRQYIETGNYTQAEVTLNKAIKDGGGVDVYVALCKVYVDQDKLLDAIDLLDKISDPVIKSELDKIRPLSPTTEQTPGFYNQYISVTVDSQESALYVNPKGEYPSVHLDAYTSPIALHDGENVIYAVSVADNGLVSPLAIFGYTVGGVIEKVDFADQNIEASIRQILQVSETEELYSNDLWSIKEFTIPSGSLDYSDLRHMAFLESLTIEKGVSGQLGILPKLTHLNTLSITDTPIMSEEIEIIGTVGSLKKLRLNNCRLSSINGLHNLSELEYLDIGNNAIRNIQPLSDLDKLQELYMTRNALDDLSDLSNCTALCKLDISYNSITSLSPLSNLTNIESLNCEHNQITNISSVGYLDALTVFIANNNQIAEISALLQNQKLQYVDISSNQISSIDVAAAIDSITYLNFSHNAVAELPTWTSKSKLITINGSYNQISSLSGLSNLQHVNNILMDYNEKISSITMLANCPTLIQVNVFGTKVTDVKALTDQSIIVNYNPVQ